MLIVNSQQEYETPIRGESLAEQVYRQLCLAVLSGAFAPEERITIRRLAIELNVSATPAREAVLRLISDGVLQTTERNAIIVPARTESAIREIFEIRQSLEGTLASRAAKRLDDANLKALIEIQKAFLKAIAARAYKEVLYYNSQFHFTIYRKADLPIYLKIVESLWLKIGPTLRYMYPILQDRHRHRRHEKIIECAKSRDPSGLKAAIVADLDTSEQAIYRYLRQEVASPQPANAITQR